MYSPTTSNQFIRRASRFGASQFSTISMSPHGNLKSPKFIPASGFPNPSLKVDSIDISSTKLKFETPEGSSNSLSDTSNKYEAGLKDIPLPSASIEEIGEAIDNQVMNRINGIQARRNQNRRVTYREEDEDRANDPNLSAAMQKNISLVKKIDRFRTFKGMMSNSKEHKFEQRLKQFSNVKTFIKISQVIKGISDSVQNSQPKRPSKHRPSGHKLTRSPSNESLKRSISKLQTPHNGLNSDEINSTKKDLNGKALDLEEIELDEVYQQLKENIIRQIGIEAFETIEADLLDPTKQREVKTRTKAQIKKLREMRDQMKNSNIFHSLIDHLATNSKVQAKNEYEEEFEARNTPFYHKLDDQIKQQNIEILTMLNTINVGENPEKEVGPPKLQLRTLLLKHELERNEELTKGYIAPSFDRSLDRRKEEADGQLVAAGLLGKYKERSQKVIEILKKKTMRMKSENTSAKVKANIEAVSTNLNKIYNRLNTIDSASASTTSNKRAKVVIKKQEKDAQDEIKGATNLPYLGKASIFRSQTKLDLHASSPMNNRSKEETSFTPRNNKTTNNGSQSARFQHNVLENKQKYYKNTQKQNSLQLGFGSSPKHSDRSGSDFHSYALQQSYYGKQSDYFITDNRSGYHSVRNSYGVSFDNSLEGIKGMLSELSVTNRQFGSELSESQRRMQEYYNTQMDSMQAAEVPDSLRIQIKQEDAKSRAALIMKLTKKVLRDAYD